MTELDDYLPLNPDEIKLGKKKGVVHDPRTFKLAELMTEAPTTPEESYVGKGELIQMYGNDSYGDCTCAAHGHRIDVQERSAGQQEVQLSQDDVLAVYSAVTGFRADDPSTDNGAYMLDVLNYMRTTGMGHEADGTQHTIGAFAAFDPHDHEIWKYASWAFGGVYFGAWLPLSAGDQLRNGERWHVVEGDRAKPGSWGGHAMHAVGYSEGSIVTATWGQRIRVTWDWLATYCDEAYAIINEDFLRASGKTRAGFNVEQLTAMLSTIH